MKVKLSTLMRVATPFAWRALKRKLRPYVFWLGLLLLGGLALGIYIVYNMKNRS